MIMIKLVILIVLLCSVSSYLNNHYNIRTKLHSNSFSSSRSLVLYNNNAVDPDSTISLNDMKDTSNEMRLCLTNGDYNKAYEILKRNPLITLTIQDAQLFLNNLQQLESSMYQNDNNNPNNNNRNNNNPMVQIQNSNQRIIEISTFLYKRFERQEVLKGYGCVNGEYPEKAIEISPMKLEEVTGLNIQSLTPKERTTNWRLAGIGFCLAEFFIGTELGIDPLFTLIPATFAIFSIDQLFYKGAGFESIYQTLFPEYKQKVVSHEAGHFLLSYLLGVPIRGCVTSAMEARKYPDIRGQAGTIFYDYKLADELAKQKVTRSSLDRVSVIIMAGIAAEALKYDKAEGGAIDEASLIQFLSSIQPPWNIIKIQGQARWAALQAILLIKEHQESYNALVDALNNNLPLGDCIMAIESNLPEVLPSAMRVRVRDVKRKTMERDLLLRYVQKQTWKVGGIGIKDDVIQNPNTDNVEVNAGIEVTNTDIVDSVQIFTEKIRMLEEVAKSGEIPLDNAESGGIWINGLKSRQIIDSNDINIDVDIDNNKPLFEPVEGYEERIKALIEKNIDQVDNEQLTVSSPVKEMLSLNRGFQIKELENNELKSKQKYQEIYNKIKTLQRKIEKVK